MKKLYSLKLMIFFAAIISAGLNAQTYTGKIGINLGSTEFVNMAHQTNRVNYDCTSVQTQLRDTSMDAQGWPKCDFVLIWDNRPGMEWDPTGIDDPDKYRRDYSGTYKGSYYGQADLVDWEPHGTWTIQNKVYDAPTNKTTFELVMSAPGPHHGLIALGFKNTKRTATSNVNTGVTNFKFIRPGYDTATTQIFVDELFTAAAKASFSCTRAMSLTGTTQLAIKYPDTLGWKSRKLLTDPWWGGSIGKKQDAAPWEVFIDYCNQANQDMWINIPIQATDDYVIQLASLIKGRLKNTLKVYIEIENEVWGFDKPKAYNEAEAGALKITAAQNYARRAYKAAKAFEKIYGAGVLNNNVRVVLMWWALNPVDLDRMCDYLTKTYGAVNQYIYGMGVDHYFGNSLMNGKDIKATPEDIILSSYTQSDADTTNFKLIASYATKYNLPAKGMVSYEGGAAMCDPLNPINVTAGACIRAYRDSCMSASIRRLYQNFVKYNGVLGNYFTLGGGGFSRYGCWGLTDDLKHTDRTTHIKCMQELLGDVNSPTPPADLFALKQKNNKIRLTWKDQSSDETGFIIERKDTSGKYILVKQTAANIITYTDSVVYYTPKYYRVKALNANGTSTYANLALVIDSTPPPPPTNLKDSVLSRTTAKVWWNKAKWNEIKEYRVYKDGVLVGSTRDTVITLYSLTCGTFKVNVVTVSTSNISSVYSDTLTMMACSNLKNISDKITVSPNPTSGIIRISLPEGEKTIVTVMNMEGQVLSAGISTGTELEFDLSAYPAGVYLVRITNSSGVGVAEVQKL